MCTYITQPFHNCWVSGGNSTDIDGQVQQYSSCSNDVVEVGTGELDKSEDVCEGRQKEKSLTLHQLCECSSMIVA